jgi:hypothetical protein
MDRCRSAHSQMFLFAPTTYTRTNYIFVGITCGSGGGNSCCHTPLSFAMQPRLHSVEMQPEAQ